MFLLLFLWRKCCGAQLRLKLSQSDGASWEILWSLWYRKSSLGLKLTALGERGFSRH